MKYFVALTLLALGVTCMSSFAGAEENAGKAIFFHNEVVGW